MSWKVKTADMSRKMENSPAAFWNTLRPKTWSKTIPKNKEEITLKVDKIQKS